MDESLDRVVRQRAAHACEYCRMPQAYYPTIPFPIDHIIARQHDGPTAPPNLALSCLHCNSHKRPNIAGLDPRTRKPTGGCWPWAGSGCKIIPRFLRSTVRVHPWRQPARRPS